MFTTLQVLSYLSVLFIFLPIVKSDFWIFRSLEYSRFQNFILSIFIIAFWFLYYSFYGNVDFLAFALSIFSAVFLFFKILPYTILYKKEVQDVEVKDSSREIKFINANVLQSNTEYQKLIDQLQKYQPDVILLLETDKKWMDKFQILKNQYPYFVEQPQDNTYGMLLYSKLKIENIEVNYLVETDVPSISCQLVLSDHTKIQLYGLHPKPPVPGESLTSTAKDKELSKIALKVRKSDMPTIVMGDLNDVAWSVTTSLFTKTSGLLDVRKGRGFYSTFSAHHWFIRFPLDYIFCSAHFGFIKMKRLKFNGSDHFPIFTQLVYYPSLKTMQQKEYPDSEILEEAIEKASK